MNEQDRCTRKRNLVEYFLRKTKFLRPWMRNLVDEYMERGIFAQLPTDIMHAYTDKNDREVAGIASLAIRDNELISLQISDLRREMGASPWEWFTERQFASLGVQNGKKTVQGSKGNVKWWMVAKLMDAVWDVWDKKKGDTLERCIHPAVFERVICRAMENAGIQKEASYSARLLRLALTSTDGTGQGLWDSYPEQERCPLGKKERMFMRLWFPEWTLYLMPADEVVELFDLERPCDMFYAAMAWNDLCLTRPKQCARQVTLYQRWWWRNTYKEKAEIVAMHVTPPFWPDKK